MKKKIVVRTKTVISEFEDITKKLQDEYTAKLKKLNKKGGTK